MISLKLLAEMKFGWQPHFMDRFDPEVNFCDDFTFLLYLCAGQAIF